MQRHHDEKHGTYCDVILREALHALNEFNASTSELTLCNGGLEDKNALRYYRILRQMIAVGFAAGAGDLISPAAPRYTDGRFTAAGRRHLERLF